MRRAARLGRLVSALHTQRSTGPWLRAATVLHGADSSVPTLQPVLAACRSSLWHAGSVDGLLSRAYGASPAAADGPVKQFNLAQLGEGIKECELLAWHVKEGDRVEEFGAVCAVQHDKASLDISSPYNGTVRKLHHTPGDIVQVGDALCDILVEGGEVVELHSPPLDEPQQQPAAAGEQQDGGLEHAPGTAKRRKLHPEASGSIGADEVADRVLTSPAVRRIAREYDISLDKVPGTGPNGRITKEDVLAYLDSLSAAGPGTAAHDAGVRLPTTEEATVSGLATGSAHIAQPTACPAPPPLAPLPAGPAAEPLVVPLRGYRKAMVRSMTATLQVPHFHFCDEVQMDALVELRQQLRGDPALGALNLTYMPFFLKAAALALRDFPALNSSLSPDQASLLQHRRMNIGVAMATPHGLAVPNIKDVQDRTILELASELCRLQTAAAANALAQADITGGTFSLSNIGTIGGTYATPLVNPPEVAIMAVGAIRCLPRFADDGVTVRAARVLNVSLGADHRVVDGATLACFARSWAHYVENPGRLLLHMK